MSFYDYCSRSTELSEAEKLKYKSFVLNEALFYMIKEYEFWMKERSVAKKSTLSILAKIKKKNSTRDCIIPDLSRSFVLIFQNNRKILLNSQNQRFSVMLWVKIKTKNVKK